MSTSTNRPVSVWITQGLILFTLYVGLKGVTNSFQICPISASETCSNGLNQRMLDLLFSSGFLMLMAIGTWGLQRRKKYGRWLGILFWAGVIATSLSGDDSKMVYHFMLHGSRDLPTLYPRAYYKDFPMNQFHPTHSALVIEAFVTMVINLLFVALAAHFSLAKNVRQFFSRHEQR